jgi:C1A family cysteine protease
MKTTIGKCGWLRDLTDHRDKLYRVPRRLLGTPLPPIVDLRQYCSAVENQTTTSSCVAHGIVGNLEILENKNKTNFYDISRLFIYYNARSLSGYQNEDGGTYIRDGIKALVNQGYCSEKLWPFAEPNVCVKPSQKAYQEGKRHIIKEYRRILDIADMKVCLAEGYPVVFGVTLYESFNAVSSTGRVPMPKTNERVLGGHCMCCVGYNEPQSVFIVRNSWDTTWGDKGYCYVPFLYMQQADDCWTIRQK